MTRASLALVVGLVLLAGLAAITVTSSPPVLAASDYTQLAGLFVETSDAGQACQPDEVLPAGISAIRPSLYATFGPRVAVSALSGGRVLTSGVRSSGWIGESPTIPVRPVRVGASRVTLCFTFGRATGVLSLYGDLASPARQTTANGHPLGGRMRVEYLKPGSRSWLSLATSVARHMGLGHWAAGTWIVFLVMGLMATVLAGASWLTVKELR